MCATSIISIMKVERPLRRSSLAPTRVKIRSINPIRAFSAGTKQPDWARILTNATVRKYVDLPPMFGPVMSKKCRLSSITTSLGTKPCWASRTGCRAWLRTIFRPSAMVGFTHERCLAVEAKHCKTSIAATFEAICARRLACFRTRSRREQNNPYSMALDLLSAVNRRSSCSRSSSVTYRFPFVICCLRVQSSGTLSA